jgi:adenylyltransferase/sulfurtransferase
MQADGRYVRQSLLSELGQAGQRALGQGSVMVLGCGALGAMAANALARAGVGRILVVDRDVVELNNLHRQVLYDEDDVAAGLPKAEAAANRLRRINSEIQVQGRALDVNPRNVEQLVQEVSLVVDGSDNFETRYLLNDACVKQGKPWIYCGVIGVSGLLMNVLPGRGPCLRCLFPQMPPVGSLPTCETRGVLGTVPMTLASIQATEAIKLLVGKQPLEGLLSVNLWDSSYRTITVLPAQECPACGRGQFDFLAARATSWVTSLCGRDAVQITPPVEASLSLDRLAGELAPLGKIRRSGLMLTLEVQGFEMMIFPDGRVIVRGTTDEALARSLYARFIGT